MRIEQPIGGGAASAFHRPREFGNIANSVVANNGSGNCAGVSPFDNGHNLQYPGTICGSTIPTGNPMLGPLQDNGGPTFTMALLSNSPAIDKGKSFGLTTDQRGPGHNDPFTVAAQYIGITVDQLRTEMGTTKSLADVAIAHGKTRDGLIAALSAEATKQITTAVDQPGTNFSGPGGRGGPGGLREFNDEAAAATYIGTTEPDLRTKLQAGQTLAQIATAAGKTRDGLIAALVADANTKIDAALAAGKITAAQATAQKSPP